MDFGAQVLAPRIRVMIITSAGITKIGCSLLAWYRVSRKTLYAFHFTIPRLIMHQILARACGAPAVSVQAVDCWQWRSGHYNHQSFLFFSPRFSCSRIKKLILLRMPKNLGVNTFSDPVGHIGFCRRCRRWASAPFAARLVFQSLTFFNSPFCRLLKIVQNIKG